MSLMEVAPVTGKVLPTSFVWSEEAIETMLKMHERGERGLEIAAAIGAPDACFVYRKMKKFGLRFKRGNRFAHGRKRKRGSFSFNNPLSQITPPKFMELKVEESQSAVSLFGLHDGICHWPISGHGLNTLFCGTVDDDACKPYCTRHGGIAYRSRTSTE